MTEIIFQRAQQDNEDRNWTEIMSISFPLKIQLDYIPDNT